MNGFDGFSELMFIKRVPLAISVMVQLHLLGKPVSLFFLIISHPPTYMYFKKNKLHSERAHWLFTQDNDSAWLINI